MCMSLNRAKIYNINFRLYVAFSSILNHFQGVRGHLSKNQAITIYLKLAYSDIYYVNVICIGQPILLVQ